MRFLSPAYLKDVMMGMIEYAEVGLCIKNLALSSREMSHTFGIIVEDFFVICGDSYVSLQQDEIGEISMEYSEGTWMAPFTRKLMIVGDHLSDEAANFFDKVYRTNDLLALDLVFLSNIFFSWDVIRNLMSVSRRLKINIASMLEFHDFSRFETIFFGSLNYNFYEFKPFAHIWNADSSTALEIYFDDKDYRMDKVNYFINVLSLFKEKLQHVRRVYLVWDHYFQMRQDFEKLLHCLTTCYSTVDDFCIGIEDWSEGSHSDTPLNFWVRQKLEFNWMADTLRAIPPQIKVKAFSVTESTCFDDVTLLEDLFPPKNFDVTSSDFWLTIVNRHEKLSNNVEYVYQCDVNIPGYDDMGWRVFE